MAVTLTNYRVQARYLGGGRVSYVIWTDVDQPDSGTFKHVVMYFDDTPDDDEGYANPETGFVSPRLPIRLFDVYYRILQTEKPVYAHWIADAATKLTLFQLGTSKEPLGEGLADQG